MSGIRFFCDKDVNYFFHMLSVAGVGYDNDYGRSYRDRYPASELGILRRYEHDLVMRGGEHEGALFWIGSYAGRAQEAIDKIEQDGGFEGFEQYNAELLDILDVLKRNYDSYCAEVWPAEEKMLSAKVKEWQTAFDAENVSGRADRLLGLDREETFCPSLVRSVGGGAEAILYAMGPGEICDVFNCEKDLSAALCFIGHEYVVFLLLSVIGDDLDMSLYDAFEGLAEFYSEQLFGRSDTFSGQREFTDLYREKMSEKTYTPAELFRMGAEKIRQRK
jgi:hypothetical protein